MNSKTTQTEAKPAVGGKTAHTPGPWTIHAPTSLSTWVYGVLDDGRNAVRVCKMAMGESGDANARLIAQAPAMYEALTLAKRIAQLDAEADTAEAHKQVHVLRAALSADAERILAAIEGGK